MGHSRRSSLLQERAIVAKAPLIVSVNIECRVRQVIPLGSHDMFFGRCRLQSMSMINIYRRKGKFCFESTEPVVYSHGEYMDLAGLLEISAIRVKKNRYKD